MATHVTVRHGKQKVDTKTKARKSSISWKQPPGGAKKWTAATSLLDDGVISVLLRDVSGTMAG